MINALELLRAQQDSASEREARRRLSDLAERKFAAEQAIVPQQLERQRLSDLMKMRQFDIANQRADQQQQFQRDLLASRERIAGMRGKGMMGRPVAVVGPDGKPVLVSPEQAIGKQPVQTVRNQPMSSAAQKELIETDEQIQGAAAALDLFKQAKSLNDKAMGFTGAASIASAGSLLPEAIRPKTIDATQDLDNILQSAALPQLKAIFGGMPTEGERKILLDVQGSSSKPPRVRKEIFDRAERAINARLKFASDKAKSLRSGEYFTGTGGVNPMDYPARGSEGGGGWSPDKENRYQELLRKRNATQ